MHLPRFTLPFARLALSGVSLATPGAESAQQQARGVLENSTWSVLNRTLYDNREYRHGASNSGARNAYKPRAARNGYAEEWGYGLMGEFRSGFTQGLIGVGLDAHAYHAQQLDSGGGRAGKARLLGVDGFSPATKSPT